MSIFDTLRWPIAASPTVEQLDQIPADLYADWLIACGINCGFDSREIAQAIHEDYIFPRMLAADQTITPEVVLLRRMILDYEHI